MTVQWASGDRPQLRSPLLVAAFEGWNDAADAATAVVDHLARTWGEQHVAELDPDDYYVYTDTRPSVSLVETEQETNRTIRWPQTRLSLCSPPGAERDLLLVRGVEPNLRWRGYCQAIVDVAHALGVDRAVTLGALLADSPHTRPIPVSGTASDPQTAADYGLAPSRYEGPTGIVGVLQDALGRAAVPTVSLWAAVPHYVSAPPCPKATVALLHRLEDLLDLPLPLGDLPEQARAWERQVDELAAEDSDVAEYIASLEEREPEIDLPEASGDAIAKEFERYLRRRDDR